MEPRTSPAPLRSRLRRDRRSTGILLAALMIGTLVVSGCSWSTAATRSAAVVPAGSGKAESSTGETSNATTPVDSSEPASTKDSDAGDATSAPKAASSEEVEVQSRLTAAAVEPGSCGSVTYTPSTASTAQVGELCRPVEQTHSTVIVLVHGGGGTGGSRTDLRAWQEKYSELGFVTLSIDYRLNDPETDDGVWPEPEQDVKASIQFMRLAASTLGTDEVIVQGHSAGARLGGVILTTPDDTTFQGSELWTGVSDAADGFIGFYGYYTGFQYHWDAYYGEGVDPPAVADAEANAGQASGAALLITGDSDSMVEPKESEGFASALAASGEDVTLVEVDGGDHGFDQHQGQLTSDGHAVMDRIQSWIDVRFETGDTHTSDQAGTSDRAAGAAGSSPRIIT